MKTLKIPYGNACYVRTNVEVQVNGGDQFVETVALKLSDVDGLTIRLKNTWGQPEVLSDFAVSSTSDNLLYILLPADLAVETYGLEVSGTWRGLPVRYYQSEAIQITKESEDCDLAEGHYNGIDVYDCGEPMVVPFSGVVFPYLYVDLPTGYLWADHVPDGGNFSIEDGQLIATYQDEGTAW